MARKSASPKTSFAGKLKGLGVAAVVLAFVGVVGWGLVQKKQKEAYRSEVSETEAKQLGLKRDLHKAELKALPNEELADKTNTTFVPKGAAAHEPGYLLSRQQNIDCDSCLKFQKEYEPALANAIELKHIANEDKDKALRAKQKWKLFTFAATGLAAGIIIERAVR